MDDATMVPYRFGRDNFLLLTEGEPIALLHPTRRVSRVNV